MKLLDRQVNSGAAGGMPLLGHSCMSGGGAAYMSGGQPIGWTFSFKLFIAPNCAYVLEMFRNFFVFCNNCSDTSPPSAIYILVHPGERQNASHRK